MRKILYGFFLIQILLFCLLFNSQAQSRQQVKNLATLARVWGFLKYYHPDAALGKPDWDSSLMQMIPQVEAVPGTTSFKKLMDDWYRSLPAAKLSSKKVNWLADSLVRIFTAEELKSIPLSGFLQSALLRLYEYHIPAASRYVTRHYQGYYLDHIVHTEDAHEEPDFPSREARLLALFRYWNTIEYFYPHRKRIKDWNKVLELYIPVFIQARDVKEYRQAVLELIHELPDAHSFLQEPGKVYFAAPFRIDYIEGKFLVGQCDAVIARDFDFKVGDEILKVGPFSTSQRLASLRKTVTGTNPSSLYRNYAAELLNIGDSVISVTFRRAGKMITRSVELHTWEVHRRIKRSPAPPLWRKMNDSVWYVQFCRITQPDTLTKLFEDIKDARWVIWDMRGYPSYPVTFRLGNFLFTQRIKLTQERNAFDSFPGTFVKSPLYFDPTATEKYMYKGSMLVLVDEYTQSLSESVAAMLRLRPNTWVMGRPTAGTTGNIAWFSLPGGLAVSYTGVGVEGTEESFRQGIGVRIDLPVKVTSKDLLLNSDPVLQEAIKFVGESEKGK